MTQSAQAHSSPTSQTSHPHSRHAHSNDSKDTKHGKDGGKPQWHAPRDPHAKVHRHRPGTHGDELHVYPLTLRVSRALHDPINALRTRYFPAHRLKVPAHLTLFHALPHSRLADVKQTAHDVAQRTRVFSVSAGRVFQMGDQGVAIDPAAGTEEGKRVHAALREDWSGFLSQQDAKAFRAHWTIVNKENDKAKVEKALHECREWEANGEPKEGEADGLVLWRYNHGEWVFEQEWDFQR
ncbi:hypothetical protein JCM11491_003967 [Sporobolomyces phaffii]